MIRLKELRERARKTQTEVAKTTQIPVRNYNHYENGVTQPDIETLCKLADYYCCSLDELVGRETKMINLNAIKPTKARLIEQILTMNDLQELRTEAFISGLMG